MSRREVEDGLHGPLGRRMTCGHVRVAPGCPSCDEAIAAMLVSQAATPPATRGRPPPTLAEARAAFPEPEQVLPATVADLTYLKDRYLLLQPEPDPESARYAAKYRAMFSPEGLLQAMPEDWYRFVRTNTMASPGNLGTFYKGWHEDGPEATATSLRQTVEYLLRGPGEEEDRLAQMVHSGTRGVGVVLLTKVLCVMQPERFLALLPYESANGKGKQDIGRVVFGLRMPDQDTTGMSTGRLAYWSNDLLRDAVLALPGKPFVDLEHAKEFLWGGVLLPAGVALSVRRPADRPSRGGHRRWCAGPDGRPGPQHRPAGGRSGWYGRRDGLLRGPVAGRARRPREVRLGHHRHVGPDAPVHRGQGDQRPSPHRVSYGERTGQGRSQCRLGAGGRDARPHRDADTPMAHCRRGLRDGQARGLPGATPCGWRHRESTELRLMTSTPTPRAADYRGGHHFPDQAVQGPEGEGRRWALGPWVKTLTRQTRRDNARFLGGAVATVPLPYENAGDRHHSGAPVALPWWLGQAQGPDHHRLSERSFSAMIPRSTLQWHPQVIVAV